jgi:hypothetical protein
MSVDKSTEAEERMKLHIFYKGKLAAFEELQNYFADKEVEDWISDVIHESHYLAEQKMKELENENAEE